jgi:opacity protein-like surface antigen
VGRVRPFLGAGLGVARNRLSSVTYRFPGIAANAATVTPDGSSSGLAYLLTAGISIPLNKRLDLDLAYRFSDLGDVRTSSGQAGLSRPTLPAGTKIPYRRNPGGLAGPWGAAEFALLILNKHLKKPFKKVF